MHAPITTQAAWKGSEINYRTEMLHLLTGPQIEEINAAVELCGARDIAEITPETFPLPHMGAWLAARRAELYHGRGAILLRGLPRARYTPDEMARIYAGLGSHLGQPIAQSYRGELLGSVLDVSDVEERVRGYRGGGPQHFHVDGSACDIVSLMCLRAAKSGGASRIASAAAIHNALLDTRPDLLDALYTGFHHRYHEMDGRHSLSPMQSAEPVPVFTQQDGHISCNIDGGSLRYAVQIGGIAWSPLQVEAYDAFQTLARSDAFYLDMDFEPGDIQFLNNRAILHGRTGFEDEADVRQRRHLMRLWLHVPEWPMRPAKQIFMNLADCHHWLGRRQPDMELPSAYLDAMAARQAQLRAQNERVTPLPTSSSYRSAADWVKAQA